jgi:hypothetical protein
MQTQQEKEKAEQEVGRLTSELTKLRKETAERKEVVWVHHYLIYFFLLIFLLEAKTNRDWTRECSSAARRIQHESELTTDNH